MIEPVSKKSMDNAEKLVDASLEKEEDFLIKNDNNWLKEKNKMKQGAILPAIPINNRGGFGIIMENSHEEIAESEMTTIKSRKW